MSDVPVPPELLVQILSRLPVTSLLRFRCVAKPWRALIDSQYFIKIHLDHSIETNSNLNIIFSGENTVYYLDLDSPTKVVKKIAHPLYFEHQDTMILGSCNGIICLTTTESDNKIVFWNPSTCNFKKIPLNPVRYLLGSERRFCIEGFGYDRLNDDYKLVRLVQYCGIDSVLACSKIEVYSLKSKGWRTIGYFPYYMCYQRYYSVFASGSLHWLVSKKPEPHIDYLVAAFDLTTEKYQFVPLPELSDKDFKVNLAVLGGCLSMVCHYPKKKIDVWVMKRYGIEDSWTKLISTTEIKVVKNLEVLRPIMYSKSGLEVLIEKDFGILFWYDLYKKKTRRFRVAGMPEFFASGTFHGSLVQVDRGVGSGTVGKEEMEEKKKNVKKRDDFLSKGFKLVL